MRTLGWLCHGPSMALIALANCVVADNGTPTAHSTTSNSSAAVPSVTVCPARTINYITHALPQSCLTSSWSSSKANDIVTGPTSAAEVSASHVGQATIEQPQTTEASEQRDSDAVGNDALPTTFMSFEDWKEMMLRRTGQDPQDLRSRKSSERGTDQRTLPDAGHAGLGEEDEIYLNFESFLQGDDKGAAESSISDELAHQEPHDDLSPGYRSKDAGKTCKERFSYSSFDAGATILKSSPGAKNAKAILAENKDSYMLLECAAEAKYVVVELSDDILVDTVVLANFEFFSSMIRHFRVSVSDRYPVKEGKWQELGLFEARNSRDIQPFLVENPQIWAKYFRIDFLTHFGNEYYCPVSLLRVHGSRMLDSWKEVAHQEEEAPELIDEYPQASSQLTTAAPTASLEPHGMADRVIIDSLEATILTNSLPELFLPQQPTCRALSPSQNQSHVASPSSAQRQGASPRGRNPPATAGNTKAPSVPVSGPEAESTTSVESPHSPSSTTPTAPHPSGDTRTNQSQSSTNSVANATSESGPDPSNTAIRSTGAVSSSKSRIVATSGAASTATVQEGFFNAITKRLQQVESNLTLSLKYIEDQSRYMQEALQRGEQKQLAKVTLFLDTLNQTVLADLRHLRDQYDQIWQSTVIALESHREQSERDILALGSRLNLLADEVVFQKRMAIVQAVLLLSCLFLVIFSRGVTIPYFAPLLDNGAAASYRASSPLAVRRSDEFQSATAMPHTTVDGPSGIRSGDHSSYHLVANDLDVELRCADLQHKEQSVPRRVDEKQNSAQYRALSPSPTPEPQEESPMTLDVRTARHGVLAPSRQSARKPLPALPEQGESP